MQRAASFNLERESKSQQRSPQARIPRARLRGTPDDRNQIAEHEQPTSGGPKTVDQKGHAMTPEKETHKRKRNPNSSPIAEGFC